VSRYLPAVGKLDRLRLLLKMCIGELHQKFACNYRGEISCFFQEFGVSKFLTVSYDIRYALTETVCGGTVAVKSS